MMDEDELRELKAYKMGYDLGWFRATESIVPLLDDLRGCMEQSATWKQIERDGGEKPIFIARILSTIMELRQIKNEQMPTIVLEQKVINDMGARLSKLTVDEWKTLGQRDNSSLDLSSKMLRSKTEIKEEE